MIAGWRDDWLRRFFQDDLHSKRIPADLRDRLFRKLQMLDDAKSDADLKVPPSNHFVQLSGNLKGWYSIRINAQWWLIFQWSESNANRVYLDNHTYR